VIYFDTSAFMKLVRAERETLALGAFLSEREGTPFVSSALLIVEARRATLRTNPNQASLADMLLSRVNRVEISDALIEAASRLPDPMLRSLDAIHLATALQLRSDLDCLVTYDARLATAAKQQRLPVAMPGS